MFTEGYYLFSLSLDDQRVFVFALYSFEVVNGKQCRNIDTFKLLNLRKLSLVDFPATEFCKLILIFHSVLTILLTLVK